MSSLTPSLGSSSSSLKFDSLPREKWQALIHMAGATSAAMDTSNVNAASKIAKARARHKIGKGGSIFSGGNDKLVKETTQASDFETQVRSILSTHNKLHVGDLAETLFPLVTSAQKEIQTFLAHVSEIGREIESNKSKEGSTLSTQDKASAARTQRMYAEAALALAQVVKQSNDFFQREEVQALLFSPESSTVSTVTASAVVSASVVASGAASKGIVSAVLPIAVAGATGGGGSSHSVPETQRSKEGRFQSASASAASSSTVARSVTSPSALPSVARPTLALSLAEGIAAAAEAKRLKTERDAASQGGGVVSSSEKLAERPAAMPASAVKKTMTMMEELAATQAALKAKKAKAAAEGADKGATVEAKAAPSASSPATSIIGPLRGATSASSRISSGGASAASTRPAFAISASAFADQASKLKKVSDESASRKKELPAPTGPLLGLLKLREVVAYSSSDEESDFSGDDSPKPAVVQSGKMKAARVSPQESAISEQKAQSVSVGLAKTQVGKPGKMDAKPAPNPAPIVDTKPSLTEQIALNKEAAAAKAKAKAEAVAKAAEATQKPVVAASAPKPTLVGRAVRLPNPPVKTPETAVKPAQLVQEAVGAPSAASSVSAALTPPVTNISVAPVEAAPLTVIPTSLAATVFAPAVSSKLIFVDDEVKADVSSEAETSSVVTASASGNPAPLTHSLLEQTKPEEVIEEEIRKAIQPIREACDDYMIQAKAGSNDKGKAQVRACLDALGKLVTLPQEQSSENIIFEALAELKLGKEGLHGAKLRKTLLAGPVERFLLSRSLAFQARYAALESCDKYLNSIVFLHKKGKGEVLGLRQTLIAGEGISLGTANPGTRHEKRQNALQLFNHWEKLRDSRSTLDGAISHAASFSVVAPGGKIN